MFAINKKWGVVIVSLSIILLVLLFFLKVDMDKRAELLCKEVHPTDGTGQCIAHSGIGTWLITLAAGIVFLFLVVGLALVFLPYFKKEEKQEFREVDVSKLDEDERIVYEILKKSTGSVYQTDIIKETGYSKVKVTRILDKMELGQIIERKRRGMTNIIVLK